MGITGYFSIERDNEIANNGGFFCQACLVGKPLDDISPDPRYCLGCYEVLSAEAEMLSGIKRKWVPQAPRAKTGRKKEVKVEKGVGTVLPIMSTIKHKEKKHPKPEPKQKVDIIPPQVQPASKVTHGKRGPKHKALPEDLITRWASEGMRNKAIVAELRKRDIIISPKTIQRILKGQRVLV